MSIEQHKQVDRKNNDFSRAKTVNELLHMTESYVQELREKINAPYKRNDVKFRSVLNP